MSGTLDFLEVATKKQIAEIQQRHAAELAPYIKVLVDIESIRTPSPIYMTTDQARCAGIDVTRQAQ